MREFEGIGEQVLDDLLQSLAVGRQAARQIRIEFDAEFDLLRLGDVAERAIDITMQIGEPQLADIDHDRARFDLRQIENVVDEHQQIVARRVDRLGEFGLLGVRLPSGFLDS